MTFLFCYCNIHVTIASPFLRVHRLLRLVSRHRFSRLGYWKSNPNQLSLVGKTIVELISFPIIFRLLAVYHHHRVSLVIILNYIILVVFIDFPTATIAQLTSTCTINKSCLDSYELTMLIFSLPFI